MHLTQNDVERPGRVPPIDDPGVKNGFRDATAKMQNEEEGAKLQRQFVQFAGRSSPFNKPKCSSKSHRSRPR